MPSGHDEFALDHDLSEYLMFDVPALINRILYVLVTMVWIQTKSLIMSAASPEPQRVLYKNKLNCPIIE